MSHKNEKNIWVLNKIPPLEYCSISRAAKLLNCEIEDFLHWHDVGVISLGINLQKTKGILKIKVGNQNSEENPLKLYLDGDLTFNELTRVYKIWSRHSKVYTLITTKDDLIPPLIHTNTLSTTYELNCIISDIWSIDSRNISVLLNDTENVFEETKLSAISPSEQILSNSFQPEMGERPVINLDNIFITKETIDIIHTHALSGKPLPFMEDLINSYENENHDIKPISPHKEKLSNFIRFLIQSNPTINKNILSTTANNRHKILRDYLDNLKSKGTEIDYDIPSSPTIERYLNL
ncbi:hypothetical protein GC796_19005 [Salmonella enterica]|uniref:Uncharacterized protein n=2 Tax=Salmonella enterica TaxID=28901 RepID=A0A756IZX3_SALER|nr:hypothetical protein [Salmonella enterica subsp. enterica serovar Javiana]EAP8470347.1 hypothetical protein [Salmonella enterica]ECE5831102.1 hypothetical protein [Salmonella enterica subsp. enterica]ECU5732373.1 hypothetical protein [Salmonella enterica subsp. enterica serovar 9,12:-:1,5]EHF3061621.1 hypothetical protein [Salmonella enterica subsp. enterica serovar 9,12-:1,5]